MNRSMPPGIVIPELPYRNVRDAVEWLCRVFGFVERLRIADHRAQFTFGEGSIVVTKMSGEQSASFSVMVRVDHVSSHFEHAQGLGAKIISPPADFPYGERQYAVEDPGGHSWAFSQTIADIDPGTWGGILFEGVGQ